jgi:AraC-like DNA-binding protein
MYIIFDCPPLPHLIVGGISNFRIGDTHLRRILQHTFDLIYVVQGELCMEENKQQFCVRAGDFLILPPHRLHRGTKCCQKETVFHWLHFYTTGGFSLGDRPITDSNLIQKSSEQFEKKPFHICLPQYGTIQPESQRQMQEAMGYITQVRINKKQNSKHFYGSATPQIKQQQLFFTILTFLCDSITPASPKDTAADILEYLEEHSAEAIHLKELSQRFSFHPAYIIRLMKHRYQQTPVQILLHIRLEKASLLLLTTNDTIQKIALASGFNDNAYFTKIFKRAFHMTPNAYRQKQKAP